jgi:hypothetical protein
MKQVLPSLVVTVVGGLVLALLTRWLVPSGNTRDPVPVIVTVPQTTPVPITVPADPRTPPRRPLLPLPPWPPLRKGDHD